MKQAVIHLSSREATLKKKIRRHLQVLGFRKSAAGALKIEDGGKDVVRALHGTQRHDRREANRKFLAERTPVLIGHFASGREIEPANISPYLERIFANTWQSELFRMAS